MKPTLKVMLAPIVAFLLFVTFVFLVVKIHPYKPGDPFFNMQNTVEYSWVWLAINPEKRVARCFDLVERRLEDLSSLHQMESVAPTLNAFDHSFQFAVKSVQFLAWDDATIYYHNVQPLMRRVESILDDVEHRLPHAHSKLLYQKVSALKSAQSVEAIQQIAGHDYLSFHIQESTVRPVVLTTLEVKEIKQARNMTEVVGKRDCMVCHANGLYMDPDSSCLDCHIRAPGCSGAQCSHCHRTDTWEIED